MRPNRNALALAVLACVIPSAANPGSTPAFDPLLDGGAICAAAAPADSPRCCAALILAEDARPRRSSRRRASRGGEAPVLYDNLGTLSFKVGTRNAKAQA